MSSLAARKFIQSPALANPLMTTNDSGELSNG
jgi:hypothetical protein